MTNHSSAQWSAKLNALKKTFPEEHFVPFVEKYATAALHGVVDRSPVGDPKLWRSSPPPGYIGGLFKNNWFVDIGGITPQTRTEISAAGSSSLAESSKLSSIRSNPYAAIYIHNSLPYANRLEHGWSKQAPLGMVAVTVASLRNLP